MNQLHLLNVEETVLRKEIEIFESNSYTLIEMKQLINKVKKKIKK
jgi:hypothetical protein